MKRRVSQQQASEHARGGLAAARALLECRRGVAALEFVLVSGPLVLLLLGFIATNAMFFTWSSMLNGAQNAAMAMATGQITSFSGSNVTCSGSLTTTQAEYYACLGLPSWATFTVNASESCGSSPPTVTVKLTVDAHKAGLSDTFQLYTGNTLTAQTVMMKQGTCP